MDVFRKLEWERSLLETSLMNHPLAPVYCTLNAAITAWHLGDWTAAALDEDGRWSSASHYFQVAVESKSALQDEMRRSHGLRVCQQIAAAAKHMTIESPTYVEGFEASDKFHFFGVPGDSVHRIKRWISVTFPAVQDGLVTRQESSSIHAVLADASMWWEATLRGTGLWSDG